MSKFEIGQTYKPKYGSEKDVITIVDRDDVHIFYTRPTVQNKVFQERYHQMATCELLRTDPWTTSNDIY